METPLNETTGTPESDKNIPKVTGIGGIFFYTDNPAGTKDWYVKNLGLDINAWGASSFDSRDLHNPDEINTLQWCPFKKDSAHFAPSQKEFMINYRVQHIEALVEKLKANGYSCRCH